MSIKSLQDVKEFSPDRFTKRVLFQEGGGVTFVLHFLPGQQLPTHKHPGTDVILLVVEGAGTLILDGKEQGVKQEDVIHCGGETEFAFHNTGDQEVRLFVVLNKVPEASYAKDI
ncbi:cupin domain-containing protein [Paenibacillus pabuli]|uniref:cupin domain-containing protein n=1 Tax=Paenibacillus pabuli TaxID=1472 RepID=UPI0007824630|nr:cupin domain-containing protein [Paenibacillus pabuli]MEC0127613.1 cupin domain-containing protein [Paenibacillus pabuli]